ncbi:MAG: heparan-alpha-glucosaminide N-acetyltransferase domain-containing protein, partial [Candidatus Kryptonium sp.]
MGARLRFVDVFRGLAILLMLHGHTADTLLNPDEKASLAFQIYTIFRGFTAPMFLFISGFAFAITTMKYVEDYLKFSQKFLKRIRKFLFITLLGYFLHLPYLSLKKIINESNFETFAILFSSDVLQVIGISLLILQISLFLLKDAFKFAQLSLYMGIFAFLISPFLFMIDFAKFLPLFISQYLNTFNGSKFPLFPWIGFILFGNYIGYKFINESKLGKSEAFLNKIFKLSLFAFPSALALELIYEKLFNPNQFLIYSSPFLSASRLSFVIALFYLVMKIEKIVNLKVHPLQ